MILLLVLILGCKNLEDPKNSEKKDLKKIVFFGDSLTAGLGLSNPENSFPHLIHKKLSKEGIELKLIHAGLNGDTTSGGISRIDWVLSRGVDYFILELGANDGMRGIKPKLIEENLVSIIQAVRQKNPAVKILLVKMLTFPNLGPIYMKEFNEVFEHVSESQKVILSPFLLEKVAGEKSLNQKDGIHPTERGHQIMAETLFPSVKNLVSD